MARHVKQVPVSTSSEEQLSATDCWAQVVNVLERMADATPCEPDAHVMRATAAELAERCFGRPGHLRAV